MRVLNVKNLIIIGVIALGVALVWPVQKGQSCYQTSDEQVKEFVKTDFLQRLTRWDDDAKFLGTTTPDITWGRIERISTVNDQEEVLNVPFEASGPDASKGYFGMYQCKDAVVEYASK